MHGLFRLVLVAAICFQTAFNANAHQVSDDLFRGKFIGMAIGDRSTSALLILNLTQDGKSVTRSATILSGMRIDTRGLSVQAVLPSLPGQ